MTNFKENIDPLLDSSGNLHSDVIKDYIHNSLSSADTYAVERHLLNHPFDTEVVEGYQAMRKNKNVRPVSRAPKVIPTLRATSKMNLSLTETRHQ